MLYKKNVKADILKILPHMLAILLQCWKYRRRDNFCLLPRILVINKQSKKKKKNKKRIDPEVNKIVSCRKKWKKCFMCYTKLTGRHVMLNRGSI